MGAPLDWLLRPTWDNDTQAYDNPPLNKCQKNFGAEWATVGLRHAEAQSFRAEKFLRATLLDELSKQF